MKTNYINQLQRDIDLDSYEQIDQSNPVTKGSTALVYNKPLVEDISMEDAANKAFKNHIIGQHDLAQDLFEDGFRVAWEQKNTQLLPIIKELVEALDKTNNMLSNYQNTLHIIDDNIELLEKYKNYL